MLFLKEKNIIASSQESEDMSSEKSEFCDLSSDGE